MNKELERADVSDLKAKVEDPSTVNDFNESYYDTHWSNLFDFIRYNPGVRHRYREIIRTIRRSSPKKLLDVGCGNGELLSEIARSGGQFTALVGVDISGETIERNRQRMEMDFRRLDIRSDHLEETFDFIICSEVVEHVEDRKIVYLNLRKMLAPGGYLLVTCPAGKIYETERHYGHISHPSSRELVDLGKIVGLDLVQIRNWGWPTYRLLKVLSNLNPDWSLRQFGETRYGLFQKIISTLLYYIIFVSLPHSAWGVQLYALYRLSGVESLDRKTALAFSKSWNNLPRKSIYTEEQFMDWIAPLTSGDLEGKDVLEMGCGNGSLMAHVLGCSPHSVTGIDLGDSVLSARELLERTGYTNWIVEQEDLTLFEGRQFDFVYCIGVLHHLKKPKSGFDSILRATKPGGRLHCWVYAYEGNFVVRWFVDPLRKVVCKLPWPIIKYAVAAPLSIPFYIYAKLLRLLSPWINLRWLPLHDYSLWIGERGFSFFHHVAFDQLVTPQTAYISKEEIAAWLHHDEIDKASIYIEMRNGNSWKFGGRKNSTPQV